MKTHSLLLAAAGMLAASQVFALNPAGFQVATTGHLVELCSVPAGDPHYDAAIGFCLVYVDAAMDYHQALTAGEKYKPLACPDIEVTREMLITVFLEWSKSNAEFMNTETPVHGVVRAASAKWPCPAG